MSDDLDSTLHGVARDERMRQARRERRWTFERVGGWIFGFYMVAVLTSWIWLPLLLAHGK